MSKKLTYFRWYVDEAETMKELLSREQIGELFNAVMDYLRDRTVAEVSLPLRYVYADYRKKIDRAQEAYDRRCAANAENGAKSRKTQARPEGEP